MNKKLFTLAAALMMGSAFTVNAQTTPLGAGTKTSQLSGWYYIATDNTHYLGAVKDANGVTVYESTVGASDAAVQNVDKYLWKITPVTDNGAVTGYKFTNKKTEGVLTFAAGGTISTSENDALTRLTWNAFTPSGSDYIYNAAGGTINTTGSIVLGLESDGTVAASLTATASWKIYKQDEIALKFGDLNGLMGGKTFSLGFPKADPQPAENLLAQKLTAVTIDGSTSWAPAATHAYLHGTYFVVSMPDDALDNMGRFDSEALFKASTFVAVDPEANYGLSGNSRASGYGFALKVVNGRDLVKTADAKAAGQIAYDNAKFTVKEKDRANNPGEYTVEATPLVMTNAEAGKEKWENKSVTITAVTSAGSTYVMTSSANATVCKAGASNMVKASEILSADAASIYTVQFLSGAKDVAKVNGSEYGKYLGVYHNTGIELLAQGPDYLNLDAPQNQWVVTAYNAANGSVTFTNRELPGTSFSATLTKTETEGVYEIASGSGLIKWGVTNAQGNYVVSSSTKNLALDKEILISLKPVTVDPAAGYADYTEAQLRDIATLKFSTSGLLAKTVYAGLAADPDDDVLLSATQNDIEAAHWDLIKNAAVKDSIYGSITYAYIKKGEETATKSIEDKAITTYALKLHGTDLYLNYDAGAYKLDEDAVHNFAIKENPDGTASLILAASSVYSTVINSSTTAMIFNGSNLFAQGEIYALNPTSLQIEMGQVAPSLESVARHASFQSVNGGFLAVGADRQAMIAATSEEAANLTFWLDTVDVEAVTPAFYISQSPSVLKADAEVRNYLWNPADSAEYFDEGKASIVRNPEYYANNDVDDYLKAMFKSATAADVEDDEAYKFQIVLADEDSEDEYVIRSVADGAYLANVNGKVILTDEPTSATLVVTLGEGDATANEAIAAESGVQVIGGEGVVTVQGAAGKVITVANILGQTIANQVATSDNVTIAVPAGIVVVAVDGEATKVVVK